MCSLSERCNNKLPLLEETDLEFIRKLCKVTAILRIRFARETGYYRDLEG